MSAYLTRSRRGAIFLACAAVLSFGMTGCSGNDADSAQLTRSTTVSVDGATIEASITAPATNAHPKALVLVLGSGSEAFVNETVRQLVDAEYATVTFDSSAELTSAQTAIAFNQIADNRGTRLPQALVAFESTGPLAWECLALDSARIASALLVSSALPAGDFPFENLRETSIRATFAEGGAVYASSYERAHIPMRDIPTPHDFLIYGDVKDDYFDRESAEFDESTWEATLASMTEWFDIWNAGGDGKSGGHNHGDG